jgi:hypothetical protein
MLFRKATWYEAWLSLKRVHKDKRARKHLLRLSLLIAIPAVLIAYLLFLIGTGAWLFIPFVIPVIWWRSRAAKRDFAPLNIAPRPEPLSFELSPAQRASLRRYFAELALIHAVMVDRAGSERYLKEKQLPEGVEIASRRTHLELLRSIGVWERMEGADREALMTPDGEWSRPRIDRMLAEIEPVRLLRWILRIDFYLPVIGRHMRPDLGIAHEMILAPQKALDGDGLIDTGTIEQARDAARHYFIRCLAEAISRGYHKPEDEKTLEWATHYSGQLRGQHSEDLLLESNLVSEATQQQVLWAITLAKMRQDFLNRASAIMKAGSPPDPPFIRISQD